MAQSGEREGHVSITWPLAGCTAAHRDAGLAALSRPGDRNVAIAAIPSADLAGLYVAQDDGLFARQGLHVTITTLASTKAVIASQLNGQVDIGAGSYAGYVAAQAAGARFRILAEASTLRPHVRVLLTTADSRITTVAALAGKKIEVNGTNSIGTLLISALLAENGIAPAKVQFVTDKQGFPDMPGQLQRGQWDAAFLAEPYASKAEEDYGQAELADLDQGATLNFRSTGTSPPRRGHGSTRGQRPRSCGRSRRDRRSPRTTPWPPEVRNGTLIRSMIASG